MVRLFKVRLFKDTKCDLCERVIPWDESFLERIYYDTNVPIGVMFPQKRIKVCNNCEFEMLQVR